MLKMNLLKPLCSMVLGGLQNLVFVVLEVCAEALQKTKSSEGNSIDILNINIFVDHGPTWISTSEFGEVSFLRTVRNTTDQPGDSRIFTISVPKLLKILHVVTHP